MSALSSTHAQQQFTGHLSAVEDAARYAFRGRRRQDREEAVAEATAAAWSAWHGLIRKGKDPLAVGVTGIANNAVRYVRNGRRIGNTTCGRGAMDIFPQGPEGPRLQGRQSRLQRPVHPRFAGRDVEGVAGLRPPGRPGRRGVLSGSISRRGWRACPARKRRVAELLAEGHGGVDVARTVGIAPSRVCQLRSELAASWREFQEQAEGDPRRAAVATA